MAGPMTVTVDFDYYETVLALAQRYNALKRNGALPSTVRCRGCGKPTPVRLLAEPCEVHEEAYENRDRPGDIRCGNPALRAEERSPGLTRRAGG